MEVNVSSMYIGNLRVGTITSINDISTSHNTLDTVARNLDINTALVNTLISQSTSLVSDQNVSGLNTFSQLPQSSLLPVNASDFVVKRYVDTVALNLSSNVNSSLSSVINSINLLNTANNASYLSDLSSNLYKSIANISSINNLSTHLNTLEATVNNLSTHVTVVDSTLNNLSTNLQTFISTLNTNVNSLVSVTNLSTHLNTVEASVNNLSTNLQSFISTLNSNVNSLVSITNLSTHLNTVESTVNNLSLASVMANGATASATLDMNSHDITGCNNIIMHGLSGVNYIEFPDGTRQYTAGGVGSGAISVAIYKTSQTIVPPPKTYKMDVLVIGSGGTAGTHNLSGSTLYYGGSGSGGNIAVGKAIPWNSFNNLVLTVASNNIDLQFPNLGHVTVFCGGNGGNATNTGGAAGLASTSRNVVPTLIGKWTNYYGKNGQAGGSTTNPHVPTTVGGITDVETPGQIGAGQSFKGYLNLWGDSPYTSGGVIITWHKTV